jgi:Fe-S oxidoreductase
MEQQLLRTLEATCIQEELPFCTAACPIHVDVRTFMACLAKGDERGARRVLDRTMPFADIVGRICDEPCRQACKRLEAGDPLAVASLERHCVTGTAAVLKLTKLPDREGRVVFFGSGLASMIAALDLARKGRSATILTTDREIGGSLRNFGEERLPLTVLDAAVEQLGSYGVNIIFDCQMDPEFVEYTLNYYDAVFMDRDWSAIDDFCLDCRHPDPLTLEVDRPGCFTGGGTGPNGYSVMQQVEEGRRAALSIERYLQKVSLTAQRDREGACATRLFTDITGIEPLSLILPADPVAGYTRQEAAGEAARCLQCQCLECVKQCAFLQTFKEYPKTLVRKIYNNQAVVQGTRTANTMINSCSLCGQCTLICPHQFPMAEVCLTTRQSMVLDSTMPPAAHEFALQDMDFSLSAAAAMFRHQPGKSSSRYLFYPGCQLAGSAPDLVEKTYLHLTRHLEDGVGLMLGCCGIPAHWSGRQELFAATMEDFSTIIQENGNPLIITACSSCYATFKEFAPELQLRSLWQILEETGLPEGKRAPLSQPMTIHDPCGVRKEPEIRASVRNIVRQLGMSVVEQPYSGELTDCCGFGGLMQFVNGPLGEEAAERKGGRSSLDSLAYCAMCRDNLAASGHRVAHLLDYCFPAADQADPLLRPNPGFSGRHENRARLKEQLLASLWQEASALAPEHKRLVLAIAPQVRELMEKRLILEDDLQKVILQAEQSGRFLEDPQTGHRLANHRPVRVTYWAEYEVLDSGYRVHNAYSHRMILPEGKKV